ncbi:MAG: peptidase, partial [Luteimonas sp.]
MNKPNILMLSVAITLALGACKKDGDAAKPAADAVKPAESDITLDESNLPPVNRFAIGDLDASKNACTDFGGYVNGKWLAANDIPSDRTSWGAFEMLDERSTSVQRQLAEQAAADANATGVKDIVGDFWSTGMDEAKVNQQGITPLKGHLDKIAALDSKEAVAEYLRTSAATGENF